MTPGSNAVIGTGTGFIRNARVGDAFRGPDGEWYEVINIASDTALSIAPNYQGGAVAAGGYSLAPMQGYVKDSADALRAATQVIASGVADMQEQVAVATEAAESAEQSKSIATEQAGIATAAANSSSENKNAAQLAAQQSGSSAQASGTAADRAETARDSIIQSEQAAAASATAAKDSADRAEEVTEGKAASGNNNDITSLLAISADGFDKLRQGISPMVGATSTTPSVKGLVPVASVADRLKVLSAAGIWVPLAWGALTGTLSAQTDLQAALDAKLNASLVDFTYLYPGGGNAASPGNVAVNSRYSITNPFPNYPVILRAQILVSGIWEETGWLGTPSSATDNYGVRATQQDTGTIIVQTGVAALAVGGNYDGGSRPKNSGNVAGGIPARVLVWRVKG